MRRTILLVRHGETEWNRVRRYQGWSDCVREDAIRRRDGSEGIYGIVEKPDFAVIVAVEDDGRIHPVQQYRYPVRARYRELPQGAWEQSPEAGALEAVRGELREETGVVAARMLEAGHLFEAYGYSTQGYRVFLATGRQPGPANLDREEQDPVTISKALADPIPRTT